MLNDGTAGDNLVLRPYPYGQVILAVWGWCRGAAANKLCVDLSWFQERRERRG